VKDVRTYMESEGSGFAPDQTCRRILALGIQGRTTGREWEMRTKSRTHPDPANAIAGFGAACCAVAAAPCAQEFLRWRAFERVMASSVCGDAGSGGAMTLGQCVHCWGAATAALSIFAVVLASVAARRDKDGRRRFV
jgi:hypothetical protein